MTSRELFDWHKRLCAKACALSRRKNHDYATAGGGESADALRNFRSGELRGLGPMERGIMWRLDDKFNRIISLLSVGPEGMKVNDESAVDTIIDMVNYAVILAVTLHDKGIINLLEVCTDAEA